MNLRTLAVSLFLLTMAPALQAADVKQPAPASAQAQVKPTPAATSRININTADAATLTSLKGVGDKKAQAIVAYRKAHGPFNSLEQFEAVPGIGPSIIAKNKAVIVFR